MPTQKTQSSTQDVNYASLVKSIFPRQNGTSAGFAALQAALNRGREVSK